MIWPFLFMRIWKSHENWQLLAFRSRKNKETNEREKKFPNDCRCYYSLLLTFLRAKLHPVIYVSFVDAVVFCFCLLLMLFLTKTIRKWMIRKTESYARKETEKDLFLKIEYKRINFSKNSLNSHSFWAVTSNVSICRCDAVMLYALLDVHLNIFFLYFSVVLKICKMSPLENNHHKNFFVQLFKWNA